MLEGMTYLMERLFSLRQEIAHLQDLNTHYSHRSDDSPLDESASETRAIRLLQIKKELATMLCRPNDSKIWWEKLRNA